MPRGRETQTEQDLIRRKELKPGRENAKKTGTIHFEKEGYGNASMQKNPPTAGGRRSF